MKARKPKIVVSNIEWDVDDTEELATLPTLLEIPNYWEEGEEEEGISDYLSNTYGYCHKGFSYSLS